MGVISFILFIVFTLELVCYICFAYLTKLNDKMPMYNVYYNMKSICEDYETTAEFQSNINYKTKDNMYFIPRYSNERLLNTNFST